MTQTEATFSISTHFRLINSKNSTNIDLNQVSNSDEAKKILEYNDDHHGLIEYEFLDWALNNNISYESIHWFVVEVCNNNEAHILSTIKTLFIKYKLFFDETSNCIKFRFKNDDGKTNKPWYNDFVIAGIAYLDECFPIDIEELFSKFKIQKSALVDPKLMTIAGCKGKGEQPERLLDILKAKNISLLLRALYDAKNVYIHWSSQNLLFYSLVDIVDSISGDPLYNIHLKNILYEAATRNQEIMNIIAKYDYPNIKAECIDIFCADLQEWFRSVRDTADMDEYTSWNYLIAQIENVKSKDDLVFITDNTDKLMIENFVPLYSLRIQIFANSELYFDECGIVQDNIDRFTNVLCPTKKPQYTFCKSTNNRMIQVSDMITGLTGALMAYLNTHSAIRIKKDISRMSQTQKENLKLFFKLRLKSVNHNMYFDHGDIIESTKQKYELIKKLLNIDERYIK